MRRVGVGLGIALTALAGIVATAPPVSGAGGGTGKGKWDPDILEIAREVEDIRGLEFEEPVKVNLLDSFTFDERVAPPKLSNTDEKLIRQKRRLQEAFGVYPSGSDPIKDLRNAEPGLLGYFDGDQIYVRRVRIDQVARVLIAHELTHALLAQSFTGATGEGEEDVLRLGMIRLLGEGDASWVADRYEDRLSPAEHDIFERDYAALREEFTDGLEDTPEQDLVQGRLPYVYGEILVDAIRGNGGQGSIDFTWENLPSDDRGVVDPRFTENSPPEPVDPPELAPDESARGPSYRLGASGLYSLLANRLPPLDALRAADQWYGDSGRTFQRDGAVCVRYAVRGRDPEGTDTIAQAVERWADELGTVTVDDGDPDTVTFSACAGDVPETDPRPPMGAFRVAVLRARVIANGIDFSRGNLGIDCAIDVYFGDATLASAIEADPAIATEPSPSLRAMLDERRSATQSTCGWDPDPFEDGQAFEG